MTSKQKKALLGGFLALPLAWFAPFTVTKVWEWHVVPLFSVPLLPFWSALTLMWTFAVIDYSRADAEANLRNDNPLGAALGRWAAWGLTLLIGWASA